MPAKRLMAAWPKGRWRGKQAPRSVRIQNDRRPAPETWSGAFPNLHPQWEFAIALHLCTLVLNLALQHLLAFGISRVLQKCADLVPDFPSVFGDGADAIPIGR